MFLSCIAFLYAWGKLQRWACLQNHWKLFVDDWVSVTDFIPWLLHSLWIPAIWLRRRPHHGVDSARLRILFKWARVDNVVHGLTLATIAGRWLGETPFVPVCMTWTLPCVEMVWQRPCMTREIKTWLSDSRVGYNSVVDRRSRRPVLSPQWQKASCTKEEGSRFMLLTRRWSLLFWVGVMLSVSCRVCRRVECVMPTVMSSV